jgi:dihydrolipoamide dehydrogenase
MVVGDIPEPADLLVVGGGPGGYASAIAAAQAGRSVTLVDRNDWSGLGGTCLQVGCIPSKALIELGHRAVQVRHGATPGLTVDTLSVDLAAFQTHKDSIVARLAGGVRELMTHYAVATLEGELRFTAARRAVVSGAGRPTHIEFNDVVLAVGARPIELAELPFDGSRVLDSAGVLGLSALPASVCIVGGGYIGLELGTAMAQLGSTVTIIEAADRIGAGFEERLMRPVIQSLSRLGVEVLTEATVEELGPTHLRVSTRSAGDHEVVAERVVVCVGRQPNTDGLGLEHLGVALLPSGHVIVDDAGIAAPHVAAIGDIVDGPALAHKATAEASAAVAALGRRPASRSFRWVPQVMFTHPEVAVTGLTRSDASEQGIDAKEVSVPVSALGRAQTLDQAQGFMRIVFDGADGTIVGAHIVGPHASELIAEVTLAVEMGSTVEDLALTIHPHPTLSEGISEAAELAAGHPLHIPAPRTGHVVPA